MIDTGVRPHLDIRSMTGPNIGLFQESIHARRLSVNMEEIAEISAEHRLLLNAQKKLEQERNEISQLIDPKQAKVKGMASACI
jgi:seryl-tRNA synthetase